MGYVFYLFIIRGGLDMNQERVLAIKTYLEAQGRAIPAYMAKEPGHWYSVIYMARLLHELGKEEEAYVALKGIYEDKVFRFDKELHGSYEYYIVEKVKYLVELSRLSLEVTKDTLESINYLDEALIMLDGAESVYPYVSIREIQVLKNTYMAM